MKRLLILLTAVALPIATGTAAAAAVPSEITVIPGSPGMTNAGLTISQGVVRHIQTDGSGYRLFNHALKPWTDATPATDGGELRDPAPCQTGAACVRSIDGNGYGTSYLSVDNKLWQHDEANSTAVEPGSVLRDVSRTYAIVDSGATRRILKPGDPAWTRTGPAGAAALWFGTMWTSTAPHTLQGVDVASGQVRSNLVSAASCPVDELQATQRYVYWSCGAAGPAGVVDIERRASVKLPDGRYLLGDGYAVRHDTATGQLLRYELTTAKPAPTVVAAAALPVGAVTDTRNISWAVDKFGGHIAYVDADNTVHVIDPGVPRSKPTVPSLSAQSDIDFAGKNLEVVAGLSRPVDSWTLEVVRAGVVITRRTGGPARREIRTGWDGRLDSGTMAPSGRYGYTLDVVADGITTAQFGNNGTVLCGTPVFRSYGCDGRPGVLAVNETDVGQWLALEDGFVSETGNYENWYLGTGSPAKSSAIVPFGDLDGDRRNDLLVRNGLGQLVVHYGVDKMTFRNARTKVIGSGWGGMRQIVTSGDLTGDGLADVLAQDSAGVLRRYNGTAAGGVANGVVVPGSWTQPRLIGPGDINRDGRADLYAVNAAGQLDVFLGTGTGTFGPATRVGTGWSSYRIVSAGDVDRDTRNDLAAVGPGGILYLYPGNGTGGFGTRKQLGTDYDLYGLY